MEAIHSHWTWRGRIYCDSATIRRLITRLWYRIQFSVKTRVGWRLSGAVAILGFWQWQSIVQTVKQSVASCSKITATDGREFVWADEIRYLGIFIVRAIKFKCSVDQAQRCFYRAANSIFARVGRLASEEVMVQLLKHKCLPILLYALEVCNLDKRNTAVAWLYGEQIFHEVIQDIEYRNSTLLSKCVWLWTAQCATGNKIWQIYWENRMYFCLVVSYVVLFSVLLLCFTCYRYTVNKDEYNKLLAHICAN